MSTKSLHGDAELFGWLLTAQAIGGLLGGMIAGHMSGKLSPARLFGLSVGLAGATLVIAANVPILPLIFPLVALVGIPVVGWLVGVQTVLQDSVADRYRHGGNDWSAHAGTRSVPCPVA